MQLDPAAGYIDFWAGAGVKLLHRLIIKGLRISHLRFCCANARICLNDLQISVAHDQRDHVECVAVSELGGLLGATRGAEMLYRFEVEEALTGGSLSSRVAEGPEDSRNLRNPDAHGGLTPLFDVLRGACVHLRQKRAQGTKPFSTCDARILSAFNLAQVVTKCPGDGVAKRQMQNFAGWCATGDTAEVR